MQRLTETILQSVPHGLFGHAEVAMLVKGPAQRQYSLVKRAIAAGEILHLRRGLYCLAPKYLRRALWPQVVAQRVYGPSYVSLASALAWHDWIPEAVFSVTSVCDKRSRTFDIPLGRFQFTRIPQKTLLAGVQRVADADGGVFFVAGPAKALADHVYVHKTDPAAPRRLIESLRIDPEQLREIPPTDIDLLEANYTSRRVRRFLKGLQRELTSCR